MRDGGSAPVNAVYPTAFVMHPDSALHDTGWRHPEHQGRLPALVRALHRETPALLEVMLQREAAAAPEEALLAVHTAAHLAAMREAVAEAERRGEPVRVEADTVVSAASWGAALGAAGAALAAVELVARGEAATAFAACRPPGHHALADGAMGFCIFNNVAIAARRLQAAWGLERVLIVDVDVHHGNGTQAIFYDDPSVYVLSLHQSPHYPGTGSAAERGAGSGTGATRNVPLPAGTDGAAYRAALSTALDAMLAEFEPELCLVSAGFDCLAGDPLGGLLLEPADLYGVTRELVERATGGTGRVVAVLEGGYAPERTGAGALQVVRALAGLPSAQD
jgi:acetoin utilization deacetylase AcuC-like enzyme